MSVDPRSYLGLGPLKKPLFGHNRSHALNATQKISKPNIQKRKITIDDKKYVVKLTAREIRTLDKKGVILK
jgi:ribosomal protein L28